MKLYYNVTGTERKLLVSAISQTLNAEAKYLGTPTFAFEIGGYHIDKTGMVTGEDDFDLETRLYQLGFHAEKREYDSSPDIDQHNQGQYADPNVPATDEMLKQAEAWLEGQPEFESLPMTEREELGLGQERLDPWGEDCMQASDIPEPDGVTIEMPLTGFTPDKLDNLTKLIKAKENLLKAALGADELPIQQTDEDGGKLQFPWFSGNLDADHVNAYTTLVALLCKTAKTKKRIATKEKELDGSPKYAMRCFLLSLGFIGDEYKQARKILLSNLEGNSSWKNGRKAEVANHEVSE